MFEETKIGKSQKILNDLVIEILDSIKDDFDYFIYEAECRIETGYSGSGFSFYKDNSLIDPSAQGPGTDSLKLVRSLCELMKDENGRSWTSFVLTYHNGGRAEVKYDYSPLPEE